MAKDPSPALPCPIARMLPPTSPLCKSRSQPTTSLTSVLTPLWCAAYDCGSVSRTQTFPASTVSIGTGTGGTTDSDGYLYFSADNIIYDTDLISDTSCGSIPDAVRENPGFSGVTETCLDHPCLTSNFSPLPLSTSEKMCDASRIEIQPTHADGVVDNWYYSVTCKGAFASPSIADNWMKEWSWLACAGKMYGSTCSTGVTLASARPPAPPISGAPAASSTACAATCDGINAIPPPNSSFATHALG